MTGRAAGFCAGNDTPGYTNAGSGCGFGRGRGGRGWRHRFFATGLTRRQQAAAADPATDIRPQDAPVEAGALHDRLQSLEQAIAALRERIEDLDRAAGRQAD